MKYVLELLTFTASSPGLGFAIMQTQFVQKPYSILQISDYFLNFPYIK